MHSAHDERGVNPRQVRGFDGVCYKLWPLLMPWLAASRCQPCWRESRSRQMWLSPLARHWRSISQVARHWRSAGQSWHWISASPGLARLQAMPRGVHLEIPDKLLTPTVPSSTLQRAHTPHTFTSYLPFPEQAHWTDIMVSALGSRVGWTRGPQKNEWTNLKLKAQSMKKHWN